MANRADDSDDKPGSNRPAAGSVTLITVTRIVKIPASAGSTATTRSDRDLPSGSVDAGDEPGLLKQIRGKTKRSS